MRSLLLLTDGLTPYSDMICMPAEPLTVLRDTVTRGEKPVTEHPGQTVYRSVVEWEDSLWSLWSTYGFTAEIETVCA